MRTWAYGLSADEWLHLAAEGEDSEVTPCCGNLGAIRELLNMLATCQGEDAIGMRLSLGRQLRQLMVGDGYGHGLDEPAKFPLLHRVLTGLVLEDAAWQRRWSQPRPEDA